jgi:hypothetical protein
MCRRIAAQSEDRRPPPLIEFFGDRPARCKSTRGAAELPRDLARRLNER